jgi:hypothetical protein
MECHHAAREEAQELAEILFALDEPWRGRFLELVANKATGWRWEGLSPTRAEVETWLSDSALCRSIGQLLNTWRDSMLVDARNARFAEDRRRRGGFSPQRRDWLRE